MKRIVRKKNYVTFMTGDEHPRTGLCQTTKYFYRKVIQYAGAPLHKYAEDITEEKFHQIIDAFGDCIYQKIIDGGVYNFPCERFGRLYIKRYNRNEKRKDGKFKYPNCLISGNDWYSVWWNNKKFKNSGLRFVLLKNTRENARKFRNEVTNSLKSYYTSLEHLRK